MKSNIIIYISNDNNEYDVYRFYASTLKDAKFFLKYSEIHLTPIVNRVHAKIVDDATGICKYSFRMGNFDVNAHINHMNTPVDIETLRNWASCGKYDNSTPENIRNAKQYENSGQYDKSYLPRLQNFEMIMKKIYLSSTIIPLFAAAEFLSCDKMLAAFIALAFALLILLRGEFSTPDDIWASHCLAKVKQYDN